MQNEKTAGEPGDQRKPIPQASPLTGKYNTIGYNFLQELIKISAKAQRDNKPLMFDDLTELDVTDHEQMTQLFAMLGGGEILEGEI